MISKRICRRLICLSVGAVMLFGCTKKPQPSDTPPTPENTKITAIDASDAKLTLYERNVLPELQTNGITLVADAVTAAPGEQDVPIRVMLFGNTGYTNYGLCLKYAEGLTPQYNTETEEPTLDTDDVSEGMILAARVDLTEQLIGFAAASAEENTSDGILYTLYFDVPENAKPDTVYPLRLTVEDLKNADGTALSPAVLQGGIQIQ